MKNKKLKWINERTVLRVVFVLLLILAIGSLFVGKPKTTFTIYEEVCRNGTQFVENLNGSSECYKGFRYGCNSSKSTKDYNDNWCYWYKECPDIICEPVEVDEIFLGECKEGFEQVDEPSGLTKHILMCSQDLCDYIGEINYCFSAYDFVVMQGISKEDLTIEWLDENCECPFLWTCEKSFVKSCSKPRYKDYEKCLKYKCGKYTVEVEQ